MQEAVIIAMKKLDQFTPGTNFTAWMASIVRGVASNTRRGERRRRDRVRRLAPGQARDRMATQPSSPRDDEVLRALERLPNEQRLCLTLKAALSHSYKEIAEATGISEATARSHVFRARRTLLDTLPHKGRRTMKPIDDDDTLKLIVRYLDGELDDSERDAFERRLNEEAELREAIERLQDVDARVRAAHPPASPRPLPCVRRTVPPVLRARLLSPSSSFPPRRSYT